VKPSPFFLIPCYWFLSSFLVLAPSPDAADLSCEATVPLHGTMPTGAFRHQCRIRGGAPASRCHGL